MLLKRICLLILLIQFVPSVWADIDATKIRRNTIDTTRRLEGTLREIIGDINTELRAVGGSASANRGTGDIYYVDSAVGSDSYTGTTPETATATLDAAVALCTANNGDVIVVMQGHAETIDNGTSDAIDLDVAGITVVGLGYGSDMPEFTYDTTTDEMVIDADNVVIYGLRFIAGVSEVANAIDVKDGADDCAVMYCEFPEPTTSTWEFDKCIVNTTADRFTVSNNTYTCADATGATNFLDLDGGVINGLFIYNNRLYGEAAEGLIHSDDADLEVYCIGNDVTNLTSGQHGIEFTAAATGILAYNRVYTDAEATSIDPGSLKCFENYVTTATDASGVLYPARDDTTTNLFGADNSNNAASTSNVTANADGTSLERLEHLYYLTEQAVSQTDTNNCDSADLFDVAGGPIMITSFVGLVTETVDSNVASLKIMVDRDDGAADTDFSTSVAVTSDALGTVYVFSDANPSVLTPLTPGSNGSTTLMSPWFCPEGMVESVFTAANLDGSISYYMTYIPLTSGVTVTAQ